MPIGTPKLDLPAIYSWPKMARPQAATLVLDALQTVFNDLAADAPIDQTARYLSLLLNGTVEATTLDTAYDLWLLRHEIQNGADLEVLLDVPNTDAARAAELSVANSNLMASVLDIVSQAGIK